LLKHRPHRVDAPFINRKRLYMSSSLNSLATCAYAFVREQCDIVTAVFEFLLRASTPHGGDNRSTHRAKPAGARGWLFVPAGREDQGR